MATAAQAAAEAATRNAGDSIRAAEGGRTLNATPEELMDMVNAITPGQIIAFRRAIFKMSTDKMRPAQFSIYEYQGFDPKAIVFRYLAIGQYHKMQPSAIIDDIMHVIAINLYMGNLSGPSKMERRAKEGRDKVAELIKAYNIKVGSTGTGLKPDTITVPRTSAAFPVLSTRMATLLPTTQTVGMPFKTENIPLCMRVGSFASFLSHNIESPTRDLLMKSVMAYICDQSIVFSTDRKTRKPTLNPVEAYGKQLTYIQAAMSSTVPEEWEKGAMLEEFKIQDQYHVLQAIVSNLQSLVGLNDPVVSETDFQKHLSAFYQKCRAERTTAEAEGTRILSEERARRRASRATAPPPPPPVMTPAPAPTTTAPATQQTPGTTVAPGSEAGSGDVGEDDDNDDLYNA